MSVPDERNLGGYHSPYKARRFALHFINYFLRQRLTRIFALNFCKYPVQRLVVWRDNFNV